MSGYMFHDEMVKRMMKSTVNPDAQILETAYETGRKQGEAETVKAVLEIIEEEIYADEKIMLMEEDESIAECISRSIDSMDIIRSRVVALKGGE